MCKFNFYSDTNTDTRSHFFSDTDTLSKIFSDTDTQYQTFSDTDTQSQIFSDTDTRVSVYTRVSVSADTVSDPNPKLKKENVFNSLV